MNKMCIALVASLALLTEMACTKKSPKLPAPIPIDPIIVEPVPDSIDLIGKRIAGTYSWVGTRHDRIPIDSYDTVFNISYNSEIVDVGERRIVLKNMYPLYLHYTTEDTLTYKEANDSMKSVTYEFMQGWQLANSRSAQVIFYRDSNKITCSRSESNRYVWSTLDAHTP